MNSFIKVPNALFDFTVDNDKHATRKFQLKPVDLYVYLYMLSCDIDGLSIKRKVKTIAEQCGVKDNKTIHSSINRLEKLGLISKVKRYNRYGINLSNGYKVTRMEGGFFMVDRRLLSFQLGTTAFMVLMYLYRCGNKGFSCPSTSKIAKATGISEPTIRNKLCMLQEYLYISKCHVISSAGDFSNNNYHLISVKERMCILKNYRNFRCRKIFVKLNRQIKNPGTVKTVLGTFFMIYRVGKLFPNTS